MSWEGDPFYAICGGPFSSIMLYPHDESEKNADDPQEDSWDFVKGPPAPASLPGAKIEENQRNQPGSESKEEALDRAQLSINGTVPLSPLHIDGDSDDMYDYDSDDLYDMRMNLDSDLEYEKYLSYDANILQEEDIEWTTSLSALGFNRRAPGPSKGFLAHAHLVEFCTLRIHPGSPATHDPNYPGKKARKFDCYVSYNKNECVYPLHTSCLELFSLYATGSRNHFSNDKFDKDALFLAFESISVEPEMPNCLNIQYPFAKTFQETEWECSRGYEFLVAPPFSDDDPVSPFIRVFISHGRDFKRSFIHSGTATKLTSKITADPFRCIPYDILFRITTLLDDASLFALCNASWTAHSELRENAQFWRHRIRRVSMPWLIEAEELLGDTELMHGVDLKGLLCALNRITAPRVGKTWPLICVANRRRIWDMCGIIGGMYDKMVAERMVLTSDKVLKKVKAQALKEYEDRIALDGY